MSPLETLFLLKILDDDDNEESKMLTYFPKYSDNIFANLTENQFRNHFRMPKSQFFEISEILFNFNDNIAIKEFNNRLLMFISYIAHHSVLMVMSEQFGLSHVTIHRK